MKEIRKKKNGKYQVIENYYIISFPISQEFDTEEDAKDWCDSNVPIEKE